MNYISNPTLYNWSSSQVQMLYSTEYIQNCFLGSRWVTVALGVILRSSNPTILRQGVTEMPESGRDLGKLRLTESRFESVEGKKK